MLWMLPALIIGLVLLELGARYRIRSKRAYYVLPPGLRLALHVDRETFPQLEPFVRFEVNGDGERGSDVPRVAPGERLYRVLVVGGSQPEGYLLDQETSWPGALHRLLARPRHAAALGASTVHVGSIARSGIGTEALDLMLARVLPRYPRLDAIVILVGASDILRWLEEGAPPSPPSPAAISDVFRCHPEGPFGWAPKTLAVSELLARTRRRWLRPVQVHRRAGKWVGAARRMRAQAKVIRATMPDPTPVLEHFERHFRNVIRQAGERADRVLVVRQSWFAKDTYTPDELAHMWHGGIGRAWCEDVTAYYSMEVTSRLMGLLDDRASRIADDVGVEQLDLMKILAPSLRVYYDFFHLTPEGAGLVASAVASMLLRQRVDRADAAGTEGAGLRAS